MSTKALWALKVPIIKGYDDNGNKRQKFRKSWKRQGDQCPQIHGMTHSLAGAILKDKEQTMQSENLRV